MDCETLEDAAWRSEPDLVRRFLAVRPNYEELCHEVAYLLRKQTQREGIAIAGVTARAKTLGSFLEKIERKGYQRPFEETQDLAGVRVVCLYRSSLALAGDIVRRELDVVAEENKAEDLGGDRFGYGAWHFIVRLGQRYAGPRYDELRDLDCEVQIRTVAQDAWTIIQHHLVYKREAEVPTELRRNLNALAGVFETADTQFDQLRVDREAYLKKVKVSPESATIPLDLDSLTAALSRWFPGRQLEGWDGQLRLVLKKLLAAGFTTLDRVDRAILDSASERRRMFAEYGLKDIRKTSDGQVPASLESLFAVALATGTDLSILRFNDRWKAAITKYRAQRTG